MKCKYCGLWMLRTSDGLYWVCPEMHGKLIPIPPVSRQPVKDV